MKNFNNIFGGSSIYKTILLAIFLLSTSQVFLNKAKSANIFELQPILSRLSDGTATNLDLYFMSPTGVSAGQSFTITFAGFSMPSSSPTGLNSDDIDYSVNTAIGTCDGSFADRNIQDGAPSGSTWGVSTSSNSITLTSASGVIAAERCVHFELGTNATAAATGDSQLTTGGFATLHTVSVSTSTGDSATSTVDVIDNDQILISATVDPTITFTISDNAIGFGTLTSGGPRYATYDGAGSGSATSAHNLTISTNASSGFSITYSGSTLTSGGNTISVATIVNDTDGTAGTEQFSISGSSTAAVRETSGYNYNFGTNPDWNFVAGTETQFASSSNSTSTQFIDMYYLANIAGSTEAGSYQTTINYIATGNF